MVWKKISTGLSSPRKKTKTIPTAMVIVHLVSFSFATEAGDMVVTGVTFGAG